MFSINNVIYDASEFFLFFQIYTLQSCIPSLSLSLMYDCNVELVSGFALGRYCWFIDERMTE
jgi:hypothetical protein